jgi:dipeptidyl-peptidase-4
LQRLLRDEPFGEFKIEIGNEHKEKNLKPSFYKLCGVKKQWEIGTAGGSVIDWRLYDSIYTERYMGMPQNNPEGYNKTSVLKSAKNLRGKLLLIQGAMDGNVYMQNTIHFVYELQKAGKQFDLMLYPTERHGVGNPAQVRHMYQMMTDFILANL